MSHARRRVLAIQEYKISAHESCVAQGCLDFVHQRSGRDIIVLQGRVRTSPNAISFPASATSQARDLLVPDGQVDGQGERLTPSEASGQLEVDFARKIWSQQCYRSSPHRERTLRIGLLQSIGDDAMEDLHLLSGNRSFHFLLTKWSAETVLCNCGSGTYIDMV